MKAFWKALAKWAIEQAAAWGVKKIGNHAAPSAGKSGSSPSKAPTHTATSARKPSK